MATMIVHVSSYKYIKGAKVHCRKGSPGVHGASCGYSCAKSVQYRKKDKSTKCDIVTQNDVRRVAHEINKPTVKKKEKILVCVGCEHDR